MMYLDDYERVALALRDAMQGHQKAGRAAQANGILDAAVVLSRRFRQDDPDFDKQGFLRSCGMPLHSMHLYED